jgi:hypothetical protein
MASLDGNGNIQLDGASTKRDIKNHLLFEIATEVANRGLLMSTLSARLTMLIVPSWWNLFRTEIEGTGHDCRIWRKIHTHRSIEPRIGVWPIL